MSKHVVVLGAAGRTGRLIVEEALRAGHRVTAAVRAPEKFAGPDLWAERAPNKRTATDPDPRYADTANKRTTTDPDPRYAETPNKRTATDPDPRNSETPNRRAVAAPDPRAAETSDKRIATSQGLRVVRADIRDPGSLREAIRGSDAVVSAVGPAGRKSGNLYSDGARAIVTAMRETGVGRLLAITSVGVRHDDPHFSWWYRSLIRPLGADLYADMGRLEEIVRATDLDWTFVRPTYLQDRAPTGVYRTVDNSTPANGWRITRGDVARFIVAELDLHRWSRRAPSLAE